MYKVCWLYKGETFEDFFSDLSIAYTELRALKESGVVCWMEEIE